MPNRPKDKKGMQEDAYHYK